MSDVLITGATGFLGREVLKAFEKKPGYHVSTLGRSADNTYCYDIVNEVPSFTTPFEIVIHVAGKAHSVPRTREEISAFYKVNVEGTLHLLKSLENNPPKAFVLISTVAVYGVDMGENISEEAPLYAKDPYGHSKILAEESVLKWGEQYNVRISVLRLPLIVGKNPPGNLGKMQRAIAKGYYFSIGKGDARKSMVLAKDVADIIPKVAATGGVYNLTDGCHPSFRELENMISIKLGKKEVYCISNVSASLLAFIGDTVNLIRNGSFPFSKNALRKIRSTLTFSDAKAHKEIGWVPQSVIQFLNENDI